MKRTISLLLTVIMILCLVPLNAITAFATNTAIIKVEKVSATPNSTVDVAVSITDNPGIASIGLTLSFDEALTLIGASNGVAFSDLTMTPPAQLKKNGSVSGSCRFAWLGNENASDDGVILNLKFQVSENAELNKDCAISLVCESGDVLDEARNTVNVTTENGKITVTDYTPGDVDGTGTINMMDVLTLCQYYVDGCQYDPDGYAINLNPECGDVDANGKVNMMDVLMICQYYVDGCKYDPDGYAVRLMPGRISCNHTMEHTVAKSATCTEDGNIEYWHCSKCGEYFSDIDASNVISLESTVIKAKGHNIEHVEATSATCTINGNAEYWYCSICDKYFSDEHLNNEINLEQVIIIGKHNFEAVAGYPATYENTGLTEGSRCTICNEWETRQEIIPVLQDTYNAIEYKNLKGAQVSHLESEYSVRYGLKSLGNPSTIAGYEFTGWFTAETGGRRVTEIPALSTDTVILYAHWLPTSYKITYNCGETGINNALNPTNYTIEDHIELMPCENSEPNKTFDYWMDSNNKIVSEIEGKVGDITLTAKYKWVSQRNIVIPYDELDNPVYKKLNIVKDSTDKDLYYLVYYMGKVNNIVINESKQGLLINGTGNEEYTHTTTVSNNESIVKSVSKTTTNANSWNTNVSTSISSTISATVSAKASVPAVGEISESVTASATASASISEGYGGSHSFTNSDSSTSSFSVTESTSEGFKKVFDKTLPYGYYRYVQTCNSDVFGIISYNIKENTYSFDTMNIVDDHINAMWDYSYDGTFYANEIDLPLGVTDEEIIETLKQLRQPLAEKYHMSVEKLSEFTIYDSIDTTPLSPTKKSVIDWSNEIDTNLENHSREVLEEEKGIIELTSDEVYFVGSSDKTYENFSILLSDYIENSEIIVHFIDFSFTTGKESAIGLNNCNNVNLQLDIIGVCDINTTYLSGRIIDLGSSSNITIVGTGNLKVAGGPGASGTDFGQDGDDGGTAITANNIIIDISGKLEVIGGKGGDGKAGSDGKGASSYDSSGTAGKNGGNGGAGGHAIIVQSAQIITPSNIYLYGGNGGKGGNGGNGGNGVTYQGQGPTNIHNDPGNGGAAGNGGNGGNGGNTGLLYDLGNGSCGGTGGIGGSKGTPGVAGCFWWDPWIGSNQYWYGNAGSEGTNGSNGTNGI